MYRQIDRTMGAPRLVPTGATRASLGALSCPYSSRDAAEIGQGTPQPHRRFRAFGPNHRGPRSRVAVAAADPAAWCGGLTTDHGSLPSDARQHARHRILALVGASALVAVLTLIW